MEAPISTKAAILLALMRGEKLYGVELVESIREITQGRIVPSFGSLYPALDALQEEGLIKSVNGETGTRGRPRRYFELTPEGRSESREIAKILRGLSQSTQKRPKRPSIAAGISPPLTPVKVR